MRILIAVDNSVYSLKAALYGLRLAQKLNAIPHVVQVIEKSKEMGNIELGILPDEAKTIWHREAEIQFENIKSEMPDIKFERQIVDGDPQKDILRIADEIKANFLVVGSHGKTGVFSHLIGSVTERLIEKSTIPVLVVTKNSIKNYHNE